MPYTVIAHLYVQYYMLSWTLILSIIHLLDFMCCKFHFTTRVACSLLLKINANATKSTVYKVHSTGLLTANRLVYGIVTCLNNQLHQEPIEATPWERVSL